MSEIDPVPATLELDWLPSTQRFARAALESSAAARVVEAARTKDSIGLIGAASSERDELALIALVEAFHTAGGRCGLVVVKDPDFAAVTESRLKSLAPGATVEILSNRCRATQIDLDERTGVLFVVSLDRYAKIIDNGFLDSSKLGALVFLDQTMPGRDDENTDPVLTIRADLKQGAEGRLGIYASAEAENLPSGFEHVEAELAFSANPDIEIVVTNTDPFRVRIPQGVSVARDDEEIERFRMLSVGQDEPTFLTVRSRRFTLDDRKLFAERRGCTFVGRYAQLEEVPEGTADTFFLTWVPASLEMFFVMQRYFDCAETNTKLFSTLSGFAEWKAFLEAAGIPAAVRPGDDLDEEKRMLIPASIGGKTTRRKLSVRADYVPVKDEEPEEDEPEEIPACFLEDAAGGSILEGRPGNRRNRHYDDVNGNVMPGRNRTKKYDRFDKKGPRTRNNRRDRDRDYVPYEDRQPRFISHESSAFCNFTSPSDPFETPRTTLTLPQMTPVADFIEERADKPERFKKPQKNNRRFEKKNPNAKNRKAGANKNAGEKDAPEGKSRKNTNEKKKSFKQQRPRFNKQDRQEKQDRNDKPRRSRIERGAEETRVETPAPEVNNTRKDAPAKNEGGKPRFKKNFRKNTGEKKNRRAGNAAQAPEAAARNEGDAPQGKRPFKKRPAKNAGAGNPKAKTKTNASRQNQERTKNAKAGGEAPKNDAKPRNHGKRRGFLRSRVQKNQSESK